MKLTALEEYGLRCLIQIARNDSVAPSRIPDVAAAEGLSDQYAAKILRVLRQGGLVVSIRGAGGGYRLTRSASEITVWDAMVVLDGPMFSGEFCSSHSGNQSDCVHTGDCTLQALWHGLGDMIEHVLRSVSIADLATDEARVANRLFSARAATTSPKFASCSGCNGANRATSVHPQPASRDEEVP